MRCSPMACSTPLGPPRAVAEGQDRRRRSPLYETEPETQVELGAVNLTNGNFYSFQLPEVVGAHASSCFPEILLASAAIPLAFPPRFMDGEPYADGGIRYLLYADRFARNVMAESRSAGGLSRSTSA